MVEIRILKCLEIRQNEEYSVMALQQVQERAVFVESFEDKAYVSERRRGLRFWYWEEVY